MPDISFGELFLIFLVALVVLGPERIPTLIRYINLGKNYISRAVFQAKSSMQQIENELQLQDMKKQLDDYSEEISQVSDSLDLSLDAIDRDIKNTVKTDSSLALDGEGSATPGQEGSRQEQVLGLDSASSGEKDSTNSPPPEGWTRSGWGGS